jgi:hypothetical protein
MSSPPVPAELYKCLVCGAFKDWPYARPKDDVPQYLRRRCDACRAIDPKRRVSTWWRLRIEPEVQMGLPLGSWRPQPGAMQGIWEDCPDAAAVAAEIARRRSVY